MSGAGPKAGSREDEMVRLPDGRSFGLARYGAEDGTPVLALHGAPASRYMFDVADPVARELGLTLYCPDRPGYGLTEEDDDPSLDKRTDDHVAIADALGLDRFAVLGISGGGPYATSLAARLGDRVSALALVSPMGPIAEANAEFGAPGDVIKALHRGHRWFFLRIPKHPRLLRANATVSAAAFKAAPKAFAYLFARMLGEADGNVLGQVHVQESLIRMTQESLRQGPVGGLADMGIFSQPWHVDYDKVSAPSMLWQGLADRIVPVPISLWLGERIPRCDIVRLPGAGHFWVYDHVGDVLSALKTMLSGSSR